MSYFSVEGARENVDNRHEVFSKLLFGAELLLVKKLDNGALARHDPLDEFDTKSREPVSVRSSNVFDMAFLDVLQKPREAFALEVESRGNVLVDLVA